MRSEPGCLKNFPAVREAWLAYLKRDLPAEKRDVYGGPKRPSVREGVGAENGRSVIDAHAA